MLPSALPLLQGLRPAIELVTGVRVGPARGPLAPITDAELAVLKDALHKAGKL